MRTRSMRKAVGAAILALACAFCLVRGAVARQEPKPIPPRELADGEKFIVYRIEIREDMIGKDVPFFVHRALEAAKAAKADAIVLDLHTNGGSLGVLQQLNDELIQTPMLVYAFVNNKAWSAGSLLAIMADKIVMSPTSTIGGAQVITSVGESIDEVVEQKVNSMLKSQARATALHKGHPVVICEAMIDRNIEIPGLTPKGEVLTLDHEQATTQTVYVDPKTSKTVVLPPLAAFIAEDVEDLLEQEGIWPAEVLSYEMVWSEYLAKWLMKISPLLLLVGMGAIFMEMKTPGVGLFLAIGLSAFALFFFASFLADLADYVEVLLVLGGLAFLAVEIFVLPGFGVAGATGIFLIFAGLIMAMVKMPPPNIPGLGFNYDMLSSAFLTLTVAFGAFFPLVWLLGRFLPSTPLLNRLFLEPADVTKADRATAVPTGLSMNEPPPPGELLGQTGLTLTDLRPAGTALFDGKRLDVMTEGDYIGKGKSVRIVEIHGNVHMVAPCEPQE